MLILLHGAWRYLSSEISTEWFRPFFIFMVHIGKLIQEELHRQERTVSWFARKLFCDRTNVYDIFQRRSIDTELLLRISMILNYDFFKHYTDEIVENL